MPARRPLKEGTIRNASLPAVSGKTRRSAGLQRVNLGAFERYGEVLSGAFIALVGVAFWLWPVL
jgi:hypothetical protein